MRRGTAIILVAAAALVGATSAYAGVATYPSTDVPKFIPDGGTINSTLAVPPGRTSIQSIEVADMGYQWGASGQELSTQLVAPDGSSMSLWEVGCLNYQPAASFTITDSAAQIPPSGLGCDSDLFFGASFLPDDPLNRRLTFFSGKGPAGTWTMRNIDSSAQLANQGNLLRWSLRVTHVPPTLSATGPATARVGTPLALTATSDANGVVVTGGDAAASSTTLAAGAAVLVPFAPSPAVLSQVKKKGKATATVTLSFTDETGGVATSSVAVALTGKKAKKKKKKKRKKGKGKKQR